MGMSGNEMIEWNDECLLNEMFECEYMKIWSKRNLVTSLNKKREVIIVFFSFSVSKLVLSYFVNQC